LEMNANANNKNYNKLTGKSIVSLAGTWVNDKLARSPPHLPLTLPPKLACEINRTSDSAGLYLLSSSLSAKCWHPTSVQRWGNTELKRAQGDHVFHWPNTAKEGIDIGSIQQDSARSGLRSLPLQGTDCATWRGEDRNGGRWHLGHTDHTREVMSQLLVCSVLTHGHTCALSSVTTTPHPGMCSILSHLHHVERHSS
jgi:hypothetical protein